MNDSTGSAVAGANVDPHLKRLSDALNHHASAVNPLVAEVKALTVENAALKQQVADYQAAMDQASAYAEQQAAAVAAAAA